MPKYYDGTKLLSMLDLNQKKPEIYLCTTNRTGGKTTYFGRLCVNKFIQNNEKFCLVYRYNYELDEISDKFFKDIGNLFFTGYTMESKRRANGIFHELYLNDESCGYAVSLNSADQIKKYSHLFSDVMRMLMDEFQSETNHYCTNETAKLLSVHTSIARGNNKQVRYVPLYMLGNTVSLLNPYYVQLGISSRLHKETRFLKGDGFVLEQGYVKSADQAQMESGFNRAFSQHEYVAYSRQSAYLNDNVAFIEKPYGKSKYICTMRYKNKDYSIKEFADSGYLYCDNKADSTFPTRISVTTEDHNINYVMLKSNEFLLSTFRYIFDRGCFRFKDLQCKETVLAALSY